VISYCKRAINLLQRKYRTAQAITNETGINFGFGSQTWWRRAVR
jgi:hypothetical protein